MNWLLSISYDGFEYHGWQIQPNQPTIQSELEKALFAIHQKPLKVYGSGRTDAQVHANLFYANFHSSKNFSANKWCHALNGILPHAIRVKSAQHVADEFHARHSSIKKCYRYLIYLDKVGNPFSIKYAWHIPYSLDLGLMRQAALLLVGSYDCSAFRAASCSSHSLVKNIDYVKLEELIDHPLATHAIEIQANSFLQHMVRIMVGTLVEVGRGKILVKQIPEIIASKDRSQSGKTAPAYGLYANGATYPKSFVIEERL